jgi:carboxyl-terminal processing protease
LLDNKRAQIVGERTYGDAGIRRPVEMEDGAAVILSVAKYFAPSGKAIQDTGVVPTVQMADTDTTPDYDENGNPIPGSEPKNVQDNLLKNAIQLVTGKSTVAQLKNPEPVTINVDQEAPILRKNDVPPQN